MVTLTPGVMGGSETYARELLRELAEKEIEVCTLVSADGAGFSDRVPERVADRVRVGGAPLRRAFGLGRLALHRKALAAYTSDAAVVHFPFTVPLPQVTQRQASVVTLHDVQHRDLPRLFSRAERMYRSVAYDRAATHADRVITVSQFCKARIVHHLGC